MVAMSTRGHVSFTVGIQEGLLGQGSEKAETCHGSWDRNGCLVHTQTLAAVRALEGLHIRHDETR